MTDEPVSMQQLLKVLQQAHGGACPGIGWQRRLALLLMLLLSWLS
jgi:hypothetical protein